MSDSPTEIEKTVAPAAEAPAEKPAESPPADGSDSKSPPSILDAVKAAIKPKAAAESSTADKSPGAESPESALPEDDGEEFKEPPTKEELARLHSKTRRRMQWFMDELSTREKRFQEVAPKAEGFDRIQKFVSDAGLTADEVNRTFETARALKQDPWTALATLEPIVEKLKQITGRALPNDLQEQARGGYISEQHASELAQLRAREAAQRQQIENQSRQAQEQQRAAAQAAVQTAFGEWESSKATDPDYTAKKAPLLHRFLKAKWADGEIPSTPQAARAQADQVMKEVEEHLRALLPKPAEIRPITGTTSPAARPQVASTLDAVRRAVGR
jgi:DNA repair exonuclease SbcCD ATPase subunit